MRWECIELSSKSFKIFWNPLKSIEIHWNLFLSSPRQVHGPREAERRHGRGPAAHVLREAHAAPEHLSFLLILIKILNLFHL